MVKDKFASYHPIVNFTFFLGAIGCGMVLMHPGYLLCSMTLSMLYYLTVHGRNALHYLMAMLVLFVLLSVINPIFNTYGEMILFSYMNGRLYTLEALLFGMALAAVVVSVLCWFASFNAVMTDDKLLYLSSRMAPAVSLVFTMALRLIPSYKNKIAQMNGARKGIGKGTDTGSVKDRLRHGMVLLSALVSWALEGGVITSDSMYSRGYGCGKRTCFSLCRFEKRDRCLLFYMAVTLGTVLICCMKGAAAASFTPHLQIAGKENPYVPAGVLAYFLFLLIPSAVNIWEEIRWYNLKSKI